MSEILGVPVDQQDDTSANVRVDQTNDADEVEQFIAEHVGEGKKYATAEEALRALAKKTLHQDTFIETLKLEKTAVEREKEQLAERLREAKTVDDLLSVLENEPERVEQSNQASEQTATTAPATTDIQTEIQKALQAEKEREAQERARQEELENQRKAFELLAKPADEGGFGSEAAAKNALKKYVGGDAKRAEIINQLGATDPDAVVAFLKARLGDMSDETLPGVGDTKRVVPDSNKHQSGGLTWSQVRKVRAENPKLYRSREFQVQVHKAAANNPNFWDE